MEIYLSDGVPDFVPPKYTKQPHKRDWEKLLRHGSAVNYPGMTKSESSEQDEQSKADWVMNKKESGAVNDLFRGVAVILDKKTAPLAHKQFSYTRVAVNSLTSSASIIETRSTVKTTQLILNAAENTRSMLNSKFAKLPYSEVNLVVAEQKDGVTIYIRDFFGRHLTSIYRSLREMLEVEYVGSDLLKAIWVNGKEINVHKTVGKN